MSDQNNPKSPAPDCSSWTLQTSGKIGQHELQFSIRGPDARRNKDELVLSLSKDLMERAGLSFGDRLELRHQAEKKLFALMPAVNGMTIRKDNRKRGYLHAVCSGTLGAFWSFDPITAEPLQVMQVEKAQRLIIFAEPDFEPTTTEDES